MTVNETSANGDSPPNCCLETAMKWIVGMYGDVRLDELDHDLSNLWKKCRAILESVEPSRRQGTQGG